MSKPSIRILFSDTKQENYKWFLNLLDEANENYELTWEKSPDTALIPAEENYHDVSFLDASLVKEKDFDSNKTSHLIPTVILNRNDDAVKLSFDDIIDQINCKELTPIWLERIIRYATQHRRLQKEALKRIAEAENKAQEAETIVRATAVVSASLELETAIERILEQLAVVVPHDSASVHLWDRGRGEVEVVGGRGYPDMSAIVGRRFPLTSDYPAEIVLQEKRTFILNNASEEYPFFQQEPHTHIRGWLGAPMIFQNQVIGMVTLNSTEANHFTEDHARLITVFSNHVAIALENARLFKETQKLATVDTLTHLYNRRHFFALAEAEHERSRRYKHPLTFLMLDLDKFKEVNDNYGHPVGDQVLQTIALIIRDSLRSSDVIGRYGGEEFVAMLTETSPENAIIAAERIRQKVLSTLIETTAGPLNISISIGIAGMEPSKEVDPDSPPPPLEIKALITRADQALYAAKKRGRNQVVSWDE